MTKKERVPSPPISSDDDYDDEEECDDEEFGESEMNSLDRDAQSEEVI
jgi:hypothetical protein